MMYLHVQRQKSMSAAVACLHAIVIQPKDLSPTFITTRG